MERARLPSAARREDDGCVVALLVLAMLIGALACDAGDRSPGWRAAAATLGLEHRDALTSALREDFDRLPTVAARDRSYFPDVLVAEELIVADWVSRDGRLKDRDREAQTIFAFRLPREADPSLRFLWGRRGEVDRLLANSLGGIVDWPDVPAFADAHHVAASDRAALRRLFDAERRARLQLPEGWRVEGAAGWIVAWVPGRRIEPDQLASQLEVARTIVAPFQSTP